MVGQTLAKGFSQSDYEVRIGSRSPEKLDAFVKNESGGKVKAGTFQDTASHGEILVIAVRGDAVEEAIGIAGTKNFSGKLVIDATNPLDFSRGMPPGILPTYSQTSLGETVQQKLAGARVVKCFNTVPSSLMFRPSLQAELLLCGNDKKAKEEVTGIVKQFGWRGTIDVGDISSARYMEYLVPLWVRAATATQNFNSAFLLMG